MWTVPASSWAFSPHIIDLDGVVPAASCKYIWVIRIPFNAENTIRVAAMITALLHLEHNTLGMLIIHSNILVLTCRCQQVALRVVVNCVQLVLWVVLTISLV